MSFNKELIARILTAFLALAKTDPELFHPKDIKMVQSNEWWIERFLVENRTEEQALNALKKTMEWRKTIGVHELDEEHYKDIKERGKFIDLA